MELRQRSPPPSAPSSGAQPASGARSGSAHGPPHVEPQAERVGGVPARRGRRIACWRSALDRASR